MPLWTSQPENIPPGLLRLRNMTPPFIGGLIKLIARLTAFSANAHTDVVAQLRLFDQHAAALAAQLTEIERQQKAQTAPAGSEADENG